MNDLILKNDKHSEPVSIPLSQVETWVGEFSDFLFRYAVFRVRNETVAEDLVQETFLAACNAKGFDGRSSVQTWLTGILKHKISDHFRREVREISHDISETELAAEDARKKFFRTDGSWRQDFAPSNRAAERISPQDKREFWESLRRGLAKLPKRTAAVFVLHEIDGESKQKICELFGITESHFWVLMHRARLQLREELDAHLFSGTADRKRPARGFNGSNTMRNFTSNIEK